MLAFGLELGPETVALQGNRWTLVVPLEVVADGLWDLDFAFFSRIAVPGAIF